ncbi:MAG: hypothetical protein JW839_09015 [Candidatus Lokiarchaeota archaeon]|nr:hypothetical protein [Candidatus Lokiarchaeota archaeon]
MDEKVLWGIVFGLAMAGTLNLGKALQKQGIQLFQKERMAGNARAKKGAIWLVGISFSAIQPVFQIVAQAIFEAPATVYSAMMGLGIVVVLVYAYKVLKEPIGKFELAGAVAIIGGTLLFGIASISWERPDSTVDWWSFSMSMVTIGVAFLVIIIYTIHTKRMWGLIWGIVAGSCGGIDNVFKSMSGRGSTGGAVELGAFSAFANAFFYISFAASMGAVLLTNVGYTRGKAVTVVPAYTVFYVLLPLVLEALFYGVPPTALQVAGISVAIVGVVLSTAFRKERVVEASKTEEPARIEPSIL